MTIGRTDPLIVELRARIAALETALAALAEEAEKVVDIAESGVVPAVGFLETAAFDARAVLAGNP